MRIGRGDGARIWWVMVDPSWGGSWVEYAVSRRRDYLTREKDVVSGISIILIVDLDWIEH